MSMFLEEKRYFCLSTLGEAVIDGLTSVNASNYTDTFSCEPRVLDVVGPAPIDIR